MEVNSTEDEAQKGNVKKPKVRSQRRTKTKRKRHLLNLSLKKQENLQKKTNENQEVHEIDITEKQRQSSTDSDNGAKPVDYEPTPKKSRSELKIKVPTKQINPTDFANNEQEYTIIDLGILEDVIGKSSVCKVCKVGTLKLHKTKKYGVVDKFALKCNFDQCLEETNFTTSKRTTPQLGRRSQGPTPFALNMRFVLGMRMIGRGQKALNLFSSMINVSDGFCQESFENISTIIDEASNIVSERSMNNAAQDIRRKAGTENSIVDTTNMFDGTWQRRGYSSLVGAVVCISAVNYQVIDIELMRKTCKICQRLTQMDKTSDKYQRIQAEHKCRRNYEGSAPNMEVTGSDRIFGRSVNKRKLRYINYVGDGDSKAYDSVVGKKPYGENVTITKLECVGHVQKRMGTGLRNLKKVTGKNKLADGKTLGGKGRLTLKEIDKLQIYYGLAIRRNVGNVVNMKQDIDAILRHRFSTDDNPNHSMCPTGPDSWCKYNRHVKDYKHISPLPKAVALHIKPVLDRLSRPELLNGCVDGYTQNAAECFNNLLWHFYPKGTFVGLTPLNIASALAIIIYNDGYQSLGGLFTMIGVTFSSITENIMKQRDHQQLYLSKRNSDEKHKKIRQALRKRRLEKEETNTEKEGVVYQSGNF